MPKIQNMQEMLQYHPNFNCKNKYAKHLEHAEDAVISSNFNLFFLIHIYIKSMYAKNNLPYLELKDEEVSEEKKSSAFGPIRFRPL